MSDGMGDLTTGKMDEILRNENMVTFLTKVSPDFYKEVRHTLDSMMDVRNSMSGEPRDGYADKVKCAIRTANRIIDRRTRKIFDSAMREVYDDTVPDLVQATKEEKRLYMTFRASIEQFKNRAVSE